MSGERAKAPEPKLDPVLAHAPHRIGRVTLAVRDLAGMSRFYRDVIGLDELGRGDDWAELGVAGRVLLVLRHRPDAPPRSAREAGLFHTAFLLPSRGDLGAWLRHVTDGSHAVTGAADHIVSEAVYLDDLEGNGIEVYADRPSRGWPWRDGAVVMRNERLDGPGIMAAAERPWSGAPTDTIVGHVHLQVGDLPRAGAFYAELLGFAVTAEYPGALFFGSGGYHHQLAGNVWNSRGAAARTESMAGLDEVELLVRDPAVMSATRERLACASLLTDTSGRDLVVHDPWGTALRLTSAGTEPGEPAAFGGR